MKHLLLLLFIVEGLNCMGQAFLQEEPQGDKPKFNYIIVWRTWDTYFKYSGDMASPAMRWRTDCAGFDNQKELIDWLNMDTGGGLTISTDHYNRSTRINENQFIMAFDFVNMKKLNITFKTVNKYLPKRVEVSEEKWTETTAEIKN